jgi:hypothetical protein
VGTAEPGSDVHWCRPRCGAQPSQMRFASLRGSTKNVAIRGIDRRVTVTRTRQQCAAVDLCCQVMCPGVRNRWIVSCLDDQGRHSLDVQRFGRVGWSHRPADAQHRLPSLRCTLQMRCELATELKSLLHFLIGVHLRCIVQTGISEQTMESVLGNPCWADHEGGPLTRYARDVGRWCARSWLLLNDGVLSQH